MTSKLRNFVWEPSNIFAGNSISVLAKMLREVVEQEREGDIKYKVVERGGKSVEKMLTNVNPTKSESCGETNCVVCSSPGGGRLCHKTRIAYEIRCNDCNAVYIGESSRNLYTRGGEHV